MPVSTASAVWNGSIGDGSGTMTMANYEGPYSAPSRFQGAEGSTPEELLAAQSASALYLAELHAARQPEPQWRARADWRAHDYQSRLRGAAFS